MNMASISILVFISALAGTTYSGFVTVDCKTETVGQYGQQVMVDCVIQAKQEAANAEIRVVTWKKQGDDKPLLYFKNEQFEELRERFSLAEPSWNNKNRNVSLLISTAAVEDEGTYTCTVVTDSGNSHRDTSLKIRAKYSKPTVKSTPEKITGDTDAVLTCSSEGGYPEGHLRWYDQHGVEWPTSVKTKAVKMKDGRFHLSSNLTLLRASIFSKYTCTVFNSSAGKEDESAIEINMQPGRHGQDKEPTSASKIVAPVVVIGSLIVGLLILLVIRRRRIRQSRRQSSIPLMVEPVPVCEPPHAMENNTQEPDVEKGDSEP